MRHRVLQYFRRSTDADTHLTPSTRTGCGAQILTSAADDGEGADHRKGWHRRQKGKKLPAQGGGASVTEARMPDGIGKNHSPGLAHGRLLITVLSVTMSAGKGENFRKAKRPKATEREEKLNWRKYTATTEREENQLYIRMENRRVGDKKGTSEAEKECATN